MLQDWYYDLSSQLLMQKLSPGSETSPVPNGALINGANIVDCSLHPNRKRESNRSSLATLDLEPLKNHRLRFLNVGAFAWFEVTVDGHSGPPHNGDRRNLILCHPPRMACSLAPGNGIAWY